MKEMGLFHLSDVTKKYNMKYLLQTSPLVYSAIAILILYQLNFTSILLAGGISIYWIASDSSFLIFSGETSLYAIFNGV